MIFTHKKDLLTLDSMLFINVFFTSLIMLGLGSTLMLYLEIPFVELLLFASGALFYIVAGYIMYELMDKKFAFISGILLGIVPFIIGI